MMMTSENGVSLGLPHIELDEREIVALVHAVVVNVTSPTFDTLLEGNQFGSWLKFSTHVVPHQCP